MKIWQLVCGSLLVLNMTGCGKKAETPPVAESTPPTTEAASPTPAATAPTTEAASPTPAASTPAASKPAETTAAGAGFPALQAAIASSKKAGEAGNFDAATTEFSKFAEAWKSVEDGVRTKSAPNYKAIEDTVEAANTAIAGKNKTAFLASLKKLDGLVAKVSK
jgi:hypothetical protein